MRKLKKGFNLYHQLYHADRQVQAEFLRRLAEHASDEEDGDAERDPRFLLKPQPQSVPEGERVRVVCETTGTQPLGTNTLAHQSFIIRTGVDSKI